MNARGRPPPPAYGVSSEPHGPPSLPHMQSHNIAQRAIPLPRSLAKPVAPSAVHDGQCKTLQHSRDPLLDPPGALPPSRAKRLSHQRPDVPKKRRSHASGEGTALASTKQPEDNVIVRTSDGYAYRRSVQPFFMNENGEFLLCRPVGPCNKTFRQTVQGGAAAHESPQQTAQREAWEEVGLRLEEVAEFICEVLPVSVSPTLTPEPHNDKGEIVSEIRSPFRYKSKKWRNRGIVGQELYPLLYSMQSQYIRNITTDSRSRNVRSEFCGVLWGPLTELADCAPPSKKEVMQRICSAVAAAAKPFLESRGISTDKLAPLLERCRETAQ